MGQMKLFANVTCVLSANKCAMSITALYWPLVFQFPRAWFGTLPNFYSKNRWASCNCLQSYKLFFSTFINFSIIADYYDHWWWQRWCINLMFMIIYHRMSDHLSKLGFALGGRHTWTFPSHHIQLFQHWRRCQQGQASFSRCFIEWPNP